MLYLIYYRFVKKGRLIMSLGKRLRECREKLHKTQLDVAAELDIGNVQLSRYEGDSRKPDPDQLIKFAEYYKTTTDFLLGRTDNPNPDLATQLNSAASKAKQGEGINEQSNSHEVYIAYLGGPPEEMDEEEAEHLKQQLEMFRLHKAKRKKERENENRK
jgi:transcriptional regulator with XRE-family HTH domain